MKRLRDRADARRRLVAGMLRTRAGAKHAGELTVTVPLDRLPPAVEVGRALRGLCKAVAHGRRPMPTMRVTASSQEAEAMEGRLRIVFEEDAPPDGRRA